MQPSSISDLLPPPLRGHLAAYGVAVLDVPPTRPRLVEKLWAEMRAPVTLPAGVSG